MVIATPVYLSIIVPFHDSVGKCAPVLRTLATIGAEEGVQIILVDDGSSDGTLTLLRAFAEAHPAEVVVIERSHAGPGAARNSGLARAKGQFIWFVDSDDDIDLDAIALAKATPEMADVDLIIWGFDHPSIRTILAPGLHATAHQPAPTDIFDPIVANWFSSTFLDRSGLRFPENCIFEATPLEAFLLPVLTDTFFKSEFAAYKCILDHRSVTRKADDRGLYDRLETVALGMKFIHSLELPYVHRAQFEVAFVRLMLWYSIRLSKWPDPSWVRAARVMRKYRDEARRFVIHDDPFDHYEGRSASRLILKLLWTASAALPSQDGYFRRLRISKWGREIDWTPPRGKLNWMRPGPAGSDA